MLLDLMLPGTDGIELMRDYPEAIANIPVIFLSAYGQEDVVARAFDMGADQLRRQALLAHGAGGENQGGPAQAGPDPPEPGEPTGALSSGETWPIDYAGRSVSVGRAVRSELTATEYASAGTSSRRTSDRTLTYDHLLERVWEHGADRRRPEADAQRAVRSLRRKLGDDAANPTYIFTEPRVGYRMAKAETPGAGGDRRPRRSSEPLRSSCSCGPQ